MKAVRRRLEAELRAVRARLGEISEVELGGDEFDAAVLTAGRELLTLTRLQLEDRRRRLAEALARVDDGTYGTCLDCGQPIAPLRLRTIPEAEACVTCQEARERAARVNADDADVGIRRERRPRKPLEEIEP